MCAVVNERKSPYAMALGRRGGKERRPARAAAMTAEERSESSRKAVRAPWAKFKSKADG